MDKYKNIILKQARKAKKDEFYTQLVDIEKELKHYKNQFRGKIIYCNCDNPYESNFFKYFASNFNALGLKKLITTNYIGLQDTEAHRIEINKVPDFNKDGAINLKDIEQLLKHKANVCTLLKGNGDFRSEECIELLKQADIVCTNPPFSLFREYIQQLMEYKKKFLIIGNINAISYKGIFSLIRDNKIWLGASIHGGNREFRVPDDYPLINAAEYRIDKDGNKYIRVKSVRWFTNLDYERVYENLVLYKKYTPEEFPKYDNYNAIEVSKTSNIPMDYDGVMGVPITFIDKYNPEQFEILGISNVRGEREHLMNGVKCVSDCTYINGIPQFVRIFIKNKKVTHS